jgi:hypothetical protein
MVPSVRGLPIERRGSLSSVLNRAFQRTSGRAHAGASHDTRKVADRRIWICYGRSGRGAADGNACGAGARRSGDAVSDVAEQKQLLAAAPRATGPTDEFGARRPRHEVEYGMLIYSFGSSARDIASLGTRAHIRER